MSEPCKYCGCHHSTVCPTIKAIEYHPDGSVSRVEFKTARDYPQIVSGSTQPPATTGRDKDAVQK